MLLTRLPRHIADLSSYQVSWRGSLPRQCRFCRASARSRHIARPQPAAFRLLQRPPHRPEPSAAAIWAPLARFIAIEERIGDWASRRKATAFAYEFVRFGIKQAWACLFGGAMVALIVGTYLWYPRDAMLGRYDFMFLAALAIQVANADASSSRRWEEAKVILVYHVVGTIMEVFKTDVGSWVYPEASIFRIGGVPLFSGFMYAAIGSYIARCWRLFDFRFLHHPPLWAVYLLGLAIYVNFYTHHYTFDIRYLLFAAAALLFGRTWIYYKVWHVHRRMPLLLGLGLVSRVHLDCRESRHRHQDLALSAPGARLVGGLVRQARIVVPAADHQLRAGCGDQPAGCDQAGRRLISARRFSRRTIISSTSRAPSRSVRRRLRR